MLKNSIHTILFIYPNKVLQVAPYVAHTNTWISLAHTVHCFELLKWYMKVEMYIYYSLREKFVLCLIPTLFL